MLPFCSPNPSWWLCHVMSLLKRYEGRRVMISWDVMISWEIGQNLRVEPWLQLTDFLLGGVFQERFVKYLILVINFTKTSNFYRRNPHSLFLRFPLSLKGTKKWTRTFQRAVTTTKTHPQPQREATVRSMIDAWSVFTRCYRKPRGPTTWERTPRGFLPLQKWWSFQWERIVGP